MVVTQNHYSRLELLRITHNLDYTVHPTIRITFLRRSNSFPSPEESPRHYYYALTTAGVPMPELLTHTVHQLWNF